MNNFTFHVPTRFVFGLDAETAIGREAKALGIRRLLIVYGQGSVVKSGLLARVRESLTQSGIDILELSGIKPNPVDGPVRKGIDLCRQAGVDGVLGLGGGSALDTAKAIAVGVPYAGDFWDFYAGKEQPKEALPILSVLTISAAGSESSISSVITNEALGQKRGLSTPFNRPKLALMNPALTYTVPCAQKTYGAADMMAHIFERYFTNTPDVGLTDELSEGALRQIIRQTPKMLDAPWDYAAHADLMWASTLAHNDSLAVGRQQDWSCHALAHIPSAHYDAPHGGVLSVIFPAYMRHVMDHDLPRFARFARRVMGVTPVPGDDRKTALLGIEALEGTFRGWGLPGHLSHWGMTEEDCAKFASEIPKNNNGRLGFFVPLTEEDITAIYKKAL